MLKKSNNLSQKLDAGKLKSITEIVQTSNMVPGNVSRLLPLAFLAPDIIDMILRGRQRRFGKLAILK